MEKYTIVYKQENNHFTVICPDFFGFVLYIKNEKDIKKEVLRVLKIYTNNENLNEGNLIIKNQEIEKELSL